MIKMLQYKMYPAGELRCPTTALVSLVAMTGLEECCITSAYLQWLCHSGEQPVARGPLVIREVTFVTCLPLR